MSWNELPLNPKTLEAETVNKVYENIVFLKDILVSKGYTVTLEAVEAYYNTPIAEILDVLLGIEADLTELCDNVFSVNYNEPWETSRFFRLTDYQRWVAILNDLYEIIVEGKGQWVYIRLNDCIPTINGDLIVMRGESIA